MSRKSIFVSRSLLVPIIATIFIFLSLVHTAHFLSRIVEFNNEMVLINFSEPSSARFSHWFEVSDTLREYGRSKAVIVKHSTQKYQCAIFFYLLNPLQNGACFAGVQVGLASLNLGGYEGLLLHLQRQGNNSGFKLTLHNRCSAIQCPVYEAYFNTSGCLQYVNIPFSEFAPYYHGKPVINGSALDTSDVVGLGLQAYGGYYRDMHQSGPGSLELYSITAYR